MSQHSDAIRFQHMLDHCREAVSLCIDKDRDSFMDDRVLQLAVVRLIEIVGEAASKISKPWRDEHPDIPWQDIIGMRNKLIHGYDYVDLEVLWDTVKDDLPTLISALETKKN